MDDPTAMPANYMLPEAEQARRKMAMELMYGKGQTQQPEMKHWTQALGNIGNSYVGNKMFNQTNAQGRGSDIYDATKVQQGTFGAGSPVPGAGGPAPFQASGPIPFSPGGGPGGPMPPTPPPSGLPPTPPVGAGPLGVPPPGGPPGPMPGAGVQFAGMGGGPQMGGLPGLSQQPPWPAGLFNPQG